MCLIPRQSVVEAVRINWAVLGGVESRLGVNETRENFVGDVYGAIFGIYKELEDWNGDGEDGEKMENTTSSSSSSTSAPAEKKAQFPPGLEGLADMKPQCVDEFMIVVKDYYDGKDYAVTSKSCYRWDKLL